MLTFHTCRLEAAAPAFDPAADALPDDVVWVDLIDPSTEEIDFIRRTMGLQLPNRAELSEIESSSRLRTERNVITISLPAMHRPKSGPPRLTPLGFLLSQERLVTVRFEEIMAFGDFRTACEAADPLPTGSIGVFVGLAEAMVDRLADGLEGIADDLEILSHKIFDEPRPHRQGARKVVEATSRAVLRRIGRRGDLTAHFRATLLGIGRAIPYLAANATWITAEAREHLKGLRQDVESLSEFEARLSDKVQFLLDATLGFISIEQQDTFKVLTIASIVGIPPTLVASIYGMNFKAMPELDWAYGYPYALGLIVLSAVVPAVWLKLRGWY